MAEKQPIDETRNERRRRRNRASLLAAAEEIMIEKGPDATTVQEIADRADVALGTFYSYFVSKDEIVIAVTEDAMKRMGQRIRTITDTFEDPGQVFAYGIRCLMEAGKSDKTWRFLLARPDVMTDVMMRVFGRYAKVDIAKAVSAKRYDVDNIDLAWRQAVWAVVAVCVALATSQYEDDEIEKILTEAVVNLLCMFGLPRPTAKEIANRPRPPLPK